MNTDFQTLQSGFEALARACDTLHAMYKMVDRPADAECVSAKCDILASVLHTLQSQLDDGGRALAAAEAAGFVVEFYGPRLRVIYPKGE